MGVVFDILGSAQRSMSRAGSLDDISFQWSALKHPPPDRPATGHPPTMRLTPRGRREKKEPSVRPLPLRRPGAGRDPYAVLRVLMDAVRWLSRNGRRRWIWVPAC